MSLLFAKIPLEKDLLREILDRADEHGTEIDEVILSALRKEFLDLKIIELSDIEVNNAISDMMNFAFGNIKPSQSFKVNELYLKTFGAQWTKLSPSTRKSLGRRFRSAVRKHWADAENGGLVIDFQGKNINNAAFYAVAHKGDL
ncbi:hypothetical protein CUU54_19850 [Pectobacterium polaris]|uniref:hypothetical protein n=1 Tax=Pectobacterium polaris TaxID=2042057 RepID=UPI000D60F97C|nr:hypothetical protein [Pectobacterium polaris]MCU1791094.1 hypothetical protein [Pectobacterium polaris]PWD62176.1 hypothetical protein DF209_03640 [Pectobacterium polaris]